MIQATQSKIHWNYFLALERDLETVSRYVELTSENFNVFSIELAHLLFAAASEVDVIAKLLCKQFSPTSSPRNIDGYRPILLGRHQDLPNVKVFVPRFGLTLTPWENWRGQNNPDWWRSYNNVKHHRDLYFNEATLKNVLNALGGLLILTYYHYSYSLSSDGTTPLVPKDTTQQLQPESGLLRFHPDCYYVALAGSIRQRADILERV